MKINQSSQLKSQNTPHVFQVLELQLLCEDIYHVTLGCAAGTVPSYKAGQYLEIILDGTGVAFSIACAPESDQKTLELHIQKLPGKPN
ncbi:MAG: hypothetical protein ACPGEF_05920, partial [Endozoicomonas sp.]